MKRTLFMLVALVAVVSLCSCSGKDSKESTEPVKTQQAEQVKEEVVKIDRSVDAVADTLGLTGGSETLYSMIGATAGKEYNDGNVELYQFDTKSDAYKQIIGEDSPLKVAAYKDGIVLIFPAGTEADNDLVEKFNEIEFK